MALRGGHCVESLNTSNIEIEIQQISTKTDSLEPESNMLFTLGELRICL